METQSRPAIQYKNCIKSYVRSLQLLVSLYLLGEFWGLYLPRLGIGCLDCQRVSYMMHGDVIAGTYSPQVSKERTIALLATVLQ